MYIQTVQQQQQKKNSDLAHFLGHWRQSEKCSEIKPPLYG